MLRMPLVVLLALALLAAPAGRSALAREGARSPSLATSAQPIRPLPPWLTRWPRPLPDLRIQQVAFDQTQTPAYDYPSVLVWVHNTGAAPTGLFYVAVLYARDGVPQAGVLKLVGGMAPGETRIVEVDLAPQGGGKVQWHEITVRVDHALHVDDPVGNVIESNEQNNVWGPIGVWL